MNNKEKSLNHLLNIRSNIQTLQQIEDVFLLVKLFYDIQDSIMRPINQVKELIIYNNESQYGVKNKQLTELFLIEKSYKDQDYIDKNQLHLQIWCNNGNFRGDEYKKELEKMLTIIIKNHVNQKMYEIILNDNTLVEDFLNQINPELKKLYVHYCLDQSIDKKDNVHHSRPKI